MAVIAAIFFFYERDIILKNIEREMQLKAYRLAKDIVNLHMNHHDNQQAFNDLLKKYSGTHIALFDKNKKVIYSTIEENFIPDKNGFFRSGNRFYLADDNTFGHLGIDAILLEYEPKNPVFKQLYHTIILTSMFAFICIIIISVILSKLFLKPIRNEISRIDSFIKNITHELNTPITSLLISANSLKKHGREKISRILVATKRIQYLYDNLTYIFMKDIKNEECISLDLKKLIQTQINLLKEVACYHQITIENDLKEKKLTAQENDMISLVNNLIMNAIKYNIPEGKIKIILDKDLCISNTGHQIPQDKIKLLSQRYFRLDLSKNGYGIGLNIIKSVCEHYGFKLSITSKVLTGEIYENTFKIKLSKTKLT